MKIINYDEFISESKLEMILESNICYTEKFLNILKDIQSPLSKKLIDILGKETGVNVTFIDAELSKDDVAAFTSSKEVNYKVINDDDCIPRTSQKILGDDVIIQVANTGTIGSIVRLFKLEDFPSNEGINMEYIRKIHTSKGRWVEFVHGNNYHIIIPFWDLRPIMSDDAKNTEIKIGRLIKKIFSKSLIEEMPSDAEIEDFVNKYKSIIQVINNALSRFKVVKGEDIRKYYHSNMYNDRSGSTLCNSCMRYASAQMYLDIYTDNPEKVSLLIFMSRSVEDKIDGRSLLWIDSEGRKIMDRIYTNNTPDEELFKEWAKREDYLFKKRQVYDDDQLLKPDGSELKPNEVRIELKPYEYSSYPYVDTFKYYCPISGILSNRIDLIDADFLSTGGTGHAYMLNSTEGSRRKIEYREGKRI